MFSCLKLWAIPLCMWPKLLTWQLKIQVQLPLWQLCSSDKLKIKDEKQFPKSHFCKRKCKLSLFTFNLNLKLLSNRNFWDNITAASIWWLQVQHFVERLQNLKVFCCKESAFKVRAFFHHVLNQVRWVYTESHELSFTTEEYTEWFL